MFGLNLFKSTKTKKAAQKRKKQARKKIRIKKQPQIIKNTAMPLPKRKTQKITPIENKTNLAANEKRIRRKVYFFKKYFP